MERFELWMRPNGMVAETERNPCGCHPDDYNMTSRQTIIEKKAKTFFIGHYPRKKFLERMRSLGYEKLHLK